MSVTEYCIRLAGADSNRSIVSCTGEQLVMVIDLLSGFFGELSWYAADVNIIPFDKEWSIYKNRVPN